jgi:hypothetical protein
LPILGKKNWRFSHKPMLWSIFFQKLAVCSLSSLSKKRQFFANFLAEIILKS